MSKIKWSQAMSDYVGDEKHSYSSIAEKYNVSRRAVADQAKKNKWPSVRRETALKLQQNLPDMLSVSLANIVARQVFLAHMLQAKALEALIKGQLTPQNIREVILCAKTGIDIERKALGMDNPQFIR